MKTILNLALLLSSILFIQAANAESNFKSNSYLYPQKTAATQPIDAIFDTYSLVECRFKTPLFLDLYMSDIEDTNVTLSNNILSIDNQQRMDLDPKITTGNDTLRFTGVKAMKTFERKTDKKKESVWSIDIDVFKHDMHILRFAKFGIDDYEEGIDYAGFYYIVKGPPSVTIPKLKKLAPNNDLGSVAIEKTAGNNTRVRCIF